MKSTVACLIVILLFGYSGPSIFACRNQEHSDADWKWLRDNFGFVLDDTMAIQKDVRVLISYRRSESLQVGELEYSFAIADQAKPDSLVVHVRTPDGDPLGAQMLALHKRFPREPISTLEKKLKFKNWDFPQQQCPALKEAVAKFSKLSIPLQLKETTVFLDPTVHEFRARAASSTINATIVDYQSPLVLWAHETRTAMKACGAEN
jgi:hypothetical protein